jgi:Flp pilus assembly protein TadB
MNRYLVGGILVASAIGSLPVMPWWVWVVIALVAAVLVWRRVRSLRDSRRVQPADE